MSACFSQSRFIYKMILKYNPRSTNLLSKKVPLIAYGLTYGIRNYSATVNEMVEKWNKEFLKSNIPQPKQSIESIVAHVLGNDNASNIYRQGDRTLESAHVKRIDNLCSERMKRMPIEYIIEKMIFRDLTLKMSRPVFIPWPETVKLVDIVLDELNPRGINKALELCSGSGAICLGILKGRPELHMVTIDKSEHACKLTKENAILNKLSDRLEIIHAEITPNSELNVIKEKYDVIVSNPPYVPTAEFDNLEPEITLYNDRAAFNGGVDGMTMMKLVLNVSSPLLNQGGKLFLEVFPTLPALIRSYLEENKKLGLTFVRSFRDFRGDERYVEVQKGK